MSRYVIDGKIAILEKRLLICEAYISNGDMFDFKAYTQSLYVTNKGNFVMNAVRNGSCLEGYPKTVTRSEAMEFLQKYPSGIKEDAYRRHIGIDGEL